MAIKKLQNNFTTPEQSNRLLELGVPADSADMKWRRIKRNSHGDKPLVKCEWNVALKDQTELVCRFMEYEYIPCWSVGRLIEIWLLCNNAQFSVPLTFCIDRQTKNIVSSVIKMLEKQKNDGAKFSELI